MTFLRGMMGAWAPAEERPERRQHRRCNASLLLHVWPERQRFCTGHAHE